MLVVFVVLIELSVISVLVSFSLFVDVLAITVLSSFCSSMFTLIVLVFPLELVAVISTVPLFFVKSNPVEVIEAISTLLDFHVTVLSVALSGFIVTVSVLLSPTLRFSKFSFICIPVTAIVDGTVVTVLVLEELVVLSLLCDDVDDAFDELLLDVELAEYGHTPLVCKCAG